MKLPSLKGIGGKLKTAGKNMLSGDSSPEKETPQPSEQFKETATQMKDSPKSMGKEMSGVEHKKAKGSAEQILGDIYKMMKEDREDVVTQREKALTKLKDQMKQEEDWHGELISALKYRKSGGDEAEETPKSTRKSAPKRVSGDRVSSPRGGGGGGGRGTPSSAPSTSSAGGGGGGFFSRIGTAIKEGAQSLVSVAPTASAIGAGVAIAGGTLAVASSVIAKEEGLPKKGKAYWDPPGQSKLVSVGYGHQIKPEEYKQGFIQAGDEQVPIKGQNGIDTVLTPEQAQKVLQADLPKYVDRAKKPLGESWNKLNDVQQAALTSYAYNTGSTASLAKQGIVEAINNGDTKGAAAIIRDKGVRTAGGTVNNVLVARRAKEAALFESKPSKSETASPAGDSKSDTTSKASPAPAAPSSAPVTQASKVNKNLKDSIVSENTTIVNNTTVNAPPQQGNRANVPMITDDDSPLHQRKITNG